MKEAGYTKYTERSCQNRWPKLTNLWKLWYQHCNQSGWGWDEIRGIPINTPEVMQRYFIDHKEMRIFRYAPPPNEKLLSEVISERVPRGREVRSLNELLESLAKGPVGSPDPLESIEDDVRELTADYDIQLTFSPTPSSSTSRSTTPSKRKASSSTQSSRNKKSKPSRTSLVYADTMREATSELVAATKAQHQTPYQKAVSLVNTDFASSTSAYRLLLLRKLQEGLNAEMYSILLKGDRLALAKDLAGPAPIVSTTKARKNREDSEVREDLEVREVTREGNSSASEAASTTITAEELDLVVTKVAGGIEEPRPISKVSKVDSKAAEASKSVEAGISSREINIIAILKDMQAATGI
jgi:hypothetical protein